MVSISPFSILLCPKKTEWLEIKKRSLMKHAVVGTMPLKYQRKAWSNKTEERPGASINLCSFREEVDWLSMWKISISFDYRKNCLLAWQKKREFLYELHCKFGFDCINSYVKAIHMSIACIGLCVEVVGSLWVVFVAVCCEADALANICTLNAAICMGSHYVCVLLFTLWSLSTLLMLSFCGKPDKHPSDKQTNPW